MGGVSGKMDRKGVREERGDWEWEGGRGILTGSLLFISLLFEATDVIESRGGACRVL